MTSGSFWNYCRDEANDTANEIVANCRLNNNKITKSKYFEHNSKIIRRTPANNNTFDTEAQELLLH